LPPAEKSQSADPPSAGAPFRGDPWRTWWLAPLAVAVVLGVAALAGWQTRWPAAVFGVRAAAQDQPAPSRPGASPGPASSSGMTPSGAPAADAPSAGVAGSAQEQAADKLAALLSQSVSDRSAVNDAYNDVMQCGSELDQDAQVFQNAASARQQLLSQLTNLPAQSALSAAMIHDLSGAWQESVQADSDYVQWAQDQASNGCTVNSTADPSYVDAERPNNQATTDKTAFAGQWDPLAAQYGLTQYQQGDL